MRFALRNKGKIEKALGSSFLNLLIASLKKYAKSRSTYITENIDGHKAIRIESLNKKDVYVFCRSISGVRCCSYSILQKGIEKSKTSRWW